MGGAQGVAVNVHPHSHYGSLIESAEEYGYLLERLDSRYVSFGPDTGHIVRGGQDLLTCLRTNISRITHLHLKDATAEGVWVGLAKGSVISRPSSRCSRRRAMTAGWWPKRNRRQRGRMALRRSAGTGCIYSQLAIEES